MARKKRKNNNNKKKKTDFKEILKIEIIALVIITFVIISLAKLGAVGNASVSLFRFLFGEWYIIGLLGLLVYGIYLMWKREKPQLMQMRLIGLYLIIISLLLFSHVTLFELITRDGSFPSQSVIKNTWNIFLMEMKGEASIADLGGGMIGAIAFALFYFLFAEAGAKIIAVIATLIGLVLLTGRPLGDALKAMSERSKPFLKKQYKMVVDKATKRKPKINTNKIAYEQEEKATEEDVIEYANMETEQELIITPPQSDSAAKLTKNNKRTVKQRGRPNNKKDLTSSNNDKKFAGNITKDFSDSLSEVTSSEYELPPLNLLKHPYETDQSGEYKKIHDNAAKLERTFQSFGVKARVTQVHLGPAVTKFEVHPDPGVKVSRIVNLSDDLALALAAKDIRIEAPIPGKSAIGIEVPNSEIALVSLKEVLESKQNDNPDEKLLIGLGRDVTGNAILSRLNKMPHLLIAGATGSGKSVCVNGIITSILMRAKPDEVKLMMIDPKMVELSVYNGIPHLLAPVVTEPRKAAQALQKVVSEMERRYELFSHSGTRNIEGYNEYARLQNETEDEKVETLPYIVVIVDELADLMMVASNDVEDAITRLAQMARAAGIHLIIATQRPSVDVITGIIKANIPSRIAFAVSSQTDSRTILDMGGAEKLLGRGDMLFLPVGASKPIRVQGAFLSDEEVEDIVNYVTGQQEAQYQEEMIPDDEPEKFADVEDELFEDAVQLIAEMQTASVSMLQRRFRIGYTRAARLIDAMEDRGIVGPYEGSRPRTVLIPKPVEDESS